MPYLNLKRTHRPNKDYPISLKKPRSLACTASRPRSSITNWATALGWVIDQYQIKTDARSGITNDPNNPDDETYILRLIKQVITVSLETVEIVNNLPPLEIIDAQP